MEDSETVNSESGRRPIAVSKPEDVAFGVAAATLGWLILTLVCVSEPLPGVAVDPSASIRVTAMSLRFYFGVATPLIALLALVTYRHWKAGHHFRLPLPGSARPALGPGIVTLVAVAWLLVTLLLRSEPGWASGWELWLAFTGCLVVMWLGVLVPNVYQTWKAGGLMKAAMPLSCLIPLPLAAAAVFVAISGQAALKVRFEFSEAALTQYVQQYERTGAAGMEFVGLFNVGGAYRRDGCIILQTQSSLDYVAGLAYCTGSLPHGDLDHIKGRWWKYELHH
jgi:hypothetical protein